MCVHIYNMQTLNLKDSTEDSTSLFLYVYICYFLLI